MMEVKVRRANFLAMAATMALTLFVAVMPVAAGEDWCWDDPSVTVLGQNVNFQVLLPRNRLAEIQDVELFVNMPAGVPAVVQQPTVMPYAMTTTLGVVRVGGSTAAIPTAAMFGQPVQVDVRLVVKAKTAVPVRFVSSVKTPLGPALTLLTLDTKANQPVSGEFALALPRL